MRILETAHHRNGVGGQPFHVVRFDRWDEPGVFTAIIVNQGNNLDDPDDETLNPTGHHSGQVNCFVLREDMGTVAFGVNSWRGDQAWADLIAAGFRP